jgi:hypothetical protein
MKYIRDTYKVPAKRGMRVRFQGELGTIISAPQAHLHVRIDGKKRIRICHPTWNIEYIPPTHICFTCGEDVENTPIHNGHASIDRRSGVKERRVRFSAHTAGNIYIEHSTGNSGINNRSSIVRRKS